MKIRKSTVVLVALAMVLPELATGSTPLHTFFNPVVFLILFLGYGVMVLLIREFVVRNNLNLFGLFIIGLSYTVVNEGLFAKTLIHETGLPIGFYDSYGYLFGISFPFFIVIALFHSLYSVLFPILVTHYFFKEGSVVPWLSKKLSYFLLVLPITVGILNFFGSNKGEGTFGQFFVLAILSLMIIAAGYYFGKKTYIEGLREKVTMKFFWLGMSTFLFSMVLLTFVMAGLKLPVILFLIVALGGVIFYITKLRTQQAIQKVILILFLVGCYIQTTITTFLIVFFTNPALLVESLGSSLIIFSGAYFLVKKIRKDIRLSGSTN
jgi:hypothetical protein